LALVLKSCDYLDIPNTNSYDIEVPLPVVARKYYAELAKELYLLLTQPKKKDEEVTAVNRAVLVNKLLQISSGAIYSDTDLQTRNKTTIQIHEAKTKALVSLVKSLDEPVLIACNFRHEQERILEAVKGCVRFDSFRSEKAQADAEKRWNAGKIRAIVSHPKSIGHGLNLQEGGRIVIWTTPTWDGELYDQMNARVARTGQTRPTEVYHLLSPGTMDDSQKVSNDLREQKLLIPVAFHPFFKIGYPSLRFIKQNGSVS
jgi:SNF2 family DNA or RNA helicase